MAIGTLLGLENRPQHPNFLTATLANWATERGWGLSHEAIADLRGGKVDA